jgi:hypothetical protein
MNRERPLNPSGAYEAANVQAAGVILADPERYGGLGVAWARLWQQRHGAGQQRAQDAGGQLGLFDEASKRRQDARRGFFAADRTPPLPQSSAFMGYGGLMSQAVRRDGRVRRTVRRALAVADAAAAQVRPASTVGFQTIDCGERRVLEAKNGLGRKWKMARVCTICRHPKRGEIEAAIIDRASFRDIAERFGTSKTAVFRHAGKHLPVALTGAKKAEDATRADSLLERIESLILDVRRIAQKAEKAGQWGQAASALREARACIELLARLRGELQASGVNVAVGINVGDLIEAINCGRARAAQETAAEKGPVSAERADP